VIKGKSKNYIFQNDILRCESFANEFTPEIYKEFDIKADKLDLSSKIDDLLNGEVVNLTENQAALHPKYRNYGFNNPSTPKCLIDAEVKAEEFSKILNLCYKKTNKVVNIITLGIGGSYEGPKLLLECLNHPICFELYNQKKLNFDFITGSDPKEFDFKLRFLDPKNTFFIVSSKSFTTDETIETLNKAFDWSGDKEKFTAITSNPKKAKKYGIKSVVIFDKEIGGRYSIWSPITQFHLCGDNFRDAFKKGGLQADIHLQENQEYLNFLKNLSFSDIWMNNIKGINTRAILSYEWNLRSLPDYFQQLEMESLGKQANPNSEFEKTGQIIFGGFGPRAQHSYFQLLHQGTQDICADIIANKEDPKSLSYAQAMIQSTLFSNEAKDLQEQERINGNVPINLFLLNKIDSYTLGYLIATWEHRVFITATMLEINPFDQFGVIAGKKFVREFFKDG